MGDPLSSALADLDEPKTLALVQERLAHGQDPAAILESCRQGMATIGERFQRGECFVSELIFSAEIFKGVSRILEPRLRTEQGPARGAVVVGTVKGDVHDIGKDLVVLLLKAANYRVHDLGVDVSPDRFVGALRETGAGVLALSALLTTAFEPMKETVAAVERAGLRPVVKIMIGGGPVNERVREFTGADAWGSDAYGAVELCGRWIGGAADG